MSVNYHTKKKMFCYCNSIVSYFVDTYELILYIDGLVFMYYEIEYDNDFKGSKYALGDFPVVPQKLDKLNHNRKLINIYIKTTDFNFLGQFTPSNIRGIINNK